MTDLRWPANIGSFVSWSIKAEENIEEWGLQNVETLLLAMQEELGELTQAHLEACHEDGDPHRISEEIDDLGALLIQLETRYDREAACDD